MARIIIQLLTATRCSGLLLLKPFLVLGNQLIAPLRSGSLGFKFGDGIQVRADHLDTAVSPQLPGVHIVAVNPRCRGGSCRGLGIGNVFHDHNFVGAAPVASFRLLDFQRNGHFVQFIGFGLVGRILQEVFFGNLPERLGDGVRSLRVDNVD